MLPFLIYTGHWLGAQAMVVGALFYLLPTSVWAVVVSSAASLETKHTYPDDVTPAVFCRRFSRILP